MRGVGRATGAIGFVNALLAGRGCAAAISLGCEVVARLDRAPPGELGRVTLPPENDTPLLRNAVGDGLQAYLPGDRWHAELEIRSAVPWARGLKSSSAITVAVLEAIANARGLSVSPEALARRAADLAQRLGLSATGAFDDALAAAAGGVVVTDNAERRLLARGQMEEGVRAVLWVPDEAHPPSSELTRRFAGGKRAGLEAARLAEAGEYRAAMTVNTRAVEAALGLDYSLLRRRIISRGAEAVGVSGMGPTLAAVVPSARAQEVEAEFPQHRGWTRIVEFRPPGHPSEGHVEWGRAGPGGAGT
jgi:shikimate kinase